MEETIRMVLNKRIIEREELVKSPTLDDGMVCAVIKVTMLTPIDDRKKERLLWYFSREIDAFQRGNVKCYWDNGIERERHKDGAEGYKVKLWGDSMENSYRGIVI